ncbi:MAG: hypothetical protein J5898_07920 [Lachnospiraceae bacterium]|nr:hypothetical protein [Lachnospiraceae bacterium]
MKKEFEKPEIEAIIFEDKDVIETSPITHTGPVSVEPMYCDPDEDQ